MSVLIYEKKGRIAYLTLNRPEKMNALDGDLIEALGNAWTDFKDDDSVWVAILTGAGKAFCTGVDASALKDPRVHPDEKGKREDPTTYSIWKPVIAAINGFALGRGYELTLHCDIRIAADTAEYGILETKFGWVAPIADLQRIVSDGIVREMAFTAQRMSAQRAYEVGLVNKVVPADRLLDEATAMAEKICENSPLAVRGTKEVITRGKGLDPQAYRELSRSISTRVTQSEDFAEGMNALRERRKPNWQGK